MDDNTALVPLGASGGAVDPLNPLALASAFPAPNPLRAAMPNLYDYVTKPPPTPLGEFPSSPSKLPAEWQRGSVLDAIPALTDVAGLALPTSKGAIFLGPMGARLLRTTLPHPAVARAMEVAPRLEREAIAAGSGIADPMLRERAAEGVQGIRQAAGQRPVTEPLRDPQLRDLQAEYALRARQASGNREDTDIFRQSGWFRGAEGMPRKEVPDIGARLVPKLDENGEPIANRYGQEFVWQHPAGDLHAAYDLPSVTLGPGHPMAAGKHSAVYDFDKRALVINADPNTRAGIAYANKAVAHEFQHVIQVADDMATGNSPFNAPMFEGYWRNLGMTDPKAIENAIKYRSGQHQFSLMNGFPTEAQEKAAMDWYKSHAGEVEARNVEARRGQGYRYLVPPSESEAIPRSQQLLRMSSRPDQVSGPNVAQKLELRSTSEPSELTGATPRRAAGEQHFHDFTLHNEQGDEVGSMTINAHNPKHLYIEWIGAYGKGHSLDQSGANSLGPKEIRSLTDEVRRHFPEAETISGFRASGARWHGKPYDATDPRYLASGTEPIIRLRGGKPPSFD